MSMPLRSLSSVTSSHTSTALPPDPLNAISRPPWTLARTILSSKSVYLIIWPVFPIEKWCLGKGQADTDLLLSGVVCHDFWKLAWSWSEPSKGAGLWQSGKVDQMWGWRWAAAMSILLWQCSAPVIVVCILLLVLTLCVVLRVWFYLFTCRPWLGRETKPNFSHAPQIPAHFTPSFI